MWLSTAYPYLVVAPDRLGIFAALVGRPFQTGRGSPWIAPLGGVLVGVLVVGRLRVSLGDRRLVLGLLRRLRQVQLERVLGLGDIARQVADQPVHHRLG